MATETTEGVTQGSSVSDNKSTEVASDEKYFIYDYVTPKIYPFCNEEQNKLQFKYSFRARNERNVNSHSVYLFTEDKVFSLWQMTAALDTIEKTDYVIPEIFFNEVDVKTLEQFGMNKNRSDWITTLNCMFTDPTVFKTAFWLENSKYYPAKIDVDRFELIAIEEPIAITESEYGFMQNVNISLKGYENVFAIDIADSGSFRPIRVYVRDTNGTGNAISFAFYNSTQTDEEYPGGLYYPYGFDTAVYLVSATSLSLKPKTEQYNHYFELRTREKTFSLFDFSYNRDFLLTGTNEELLGCPPSFCYSREFDDIIRLHDGNQFLIYKEWIWNFTEPGQAIDYKEAVISNMSSRQHITRPKNFKNPFKFGVRRLVDGSFTDESILYIFRNGSFLSSKDDNIFQNNTPFPNYTRIDQFFVGLPSTTFDAILYHKESRTAFFINDDKYWAYSLANKTLTSGGLQIENLGLPYDFKVKSIYAPEDQTGKQTKFYLFAENRYILFEGNEFQNGQFKAREHTYYCISTNFFDCKGKEFQCPEPSTTTTETTKEEKEKEEEPTNILLYVIIAIIIIVVLVIIIILCLSYQKNKSKKTNAKISTEEPEELGTTSTSGKNQGMDQSAISSTYSEVIRSKM